MTDEPVAVMMDQHLEDRDLADLMEAAHKGTYMGTRSRNTEPLVSLTDSSTFDFHATSTQGEVPTGPAGPTVVDRGGSVDTPPMKLRNTQPKNLLAASVKGGVMGSLHRSVTGTHQLLANTVRFNAMGGKQRKLHEQLKDPRCEEAWRKEISDLLANGNLVMMNISDVPKGYKAIGYAAAFKHKYNPLTKQYTGTRARLAPHGFRQIQGRDYDPNETAAPTLSLEALHVYAMFSATRCKHKRARDVVSAFTSVELKELIIIEWPVGLPYVKGKCMRLGKMVYGLKQAAWVFHEKVRAVLLGLGFEPTLFDSCLYFQFVYDKERPTERYLVIIAVYVDNFNLIAEREQDAIYFDSELAKCLETRVEDPMVMLGIVFVDTAESLQLNMRFQIDAILERYGMLDCNVKKTALPSSTVLMPANKDLQTPESQEYPYAEVVGSIMWVVRCTLVTLKYSCNVLCAHMTTWDSTHVAAATHMLKYLKFMRDEGLRFRKHVRVDRLSMKIFCDANFAGDNPGMKSTSAFALIVECIGTVLFLSKQQSTVSKSTMEAEYRCASHASQSFEGYVNLFAQLGSIVSSPSPLLIDNTATIAAIRTQASSFKLRHLLIDHAYLRELFHRQLILPEHVEGQHNPADLGTKCLSAEATARYTTYLLDSAGDHTL